MARKPAKADVHAVTISPAVYLRVSTDEQADSGLGIAAQLARCGAQCTAKGWPAPAIYKDEGISGTIAPGPKRPALARLLADVASGQVNAVVVLDLSRLARNVKLILSMIDELDAAGAVFVSCKENFDTSTAMGRAMLGIVAVFGQLERDLTSERTVAALAERGKQHGYKSGRLPYGYRREPGQERIDVDDSAAWLVRSIFDQRQAGATLRAIAAQMNERAPGPRGQQWHASTIKMIVDNEPTYRGHVDHWPAILAARHQLENTPHHVLPVEITATSAAINAQRQQINALVATLRTKSAVGQRDGKRLITLLTELITLHASQIAPWAILEELDRPHSDDTERDQAIASLRQRPLTEYRQDGWLAAMQLVAAGLASGPIRRQADQWALINLAVEISGAALVTNERITDLLDRLQGNKIDVARWLALLD